MIKSQKSCASDPFVHLHVHSNFSFLDGATPPERLLEKAADLGMPAVALTDHHGLYGSVRFMQAAPAYGVKPIIGVEIEVDDREQLSGRRHRTTFDGGKAKPKLQTATPHLATRNSTSATRSHLLLLARDREGYSSLCRIITKAQLDHQDEPYISLDDLASLAHHLVVLSGCPRGAVPSALPSSGTNLERSIHAAAQYGEIFGRENFWIELQHHLLPGDDLRNQQLVEVARKTKLRWVITNNAHYARREEYRLRDVMACIQTNTTLDQWADVRHRNAEYYLKSSSQLRQAFSALPRTVVEAGLRASGQIAERCSLTDEGAVLATITRAPSYPLLQGESPFSFLYGLCNEGLRRKYQPLNSDAVNRLAYELDVVEQMDLSEFFLCVWDMVQFSRNRGIRCAGRGSAADSIIAYVLDITTVDPLANNLLFDRFLNPGRVGMPDVDIDFDSRRRDEVIEYVENKYGPEHSAMVANLVTYRSRSAFRDVAKAMGYPPGLIDHLASSLSYRSVKRMREDLAAAGIEMEETGAMNRELAAPRGGSPPTRTKSRSRGPSPGAIAERIANAQWQTTSNPPVETGPSAHGRSSVASQERTSTTQPHSSFGQLETIIELCEQLDGYPRHLSLHNGGMLITREPLVDVVPIEYATSGVRVCQFNKDDVEALGLIKFDILGLRTLSIVDESVTMIGEFEGIDLAIDDLPLDDERVYDFICTSKTIGVFQIESPGQWHLLQRAQPRTFGDLIIQIALFRPGPLQGGMVNPYVERRCGREPVTYMHPSLEPALKDTLGVVIFQEQVLQVAHDFAGLSYADADGLRRAMSHYRTQAEMDVCRVAFIESAVRLGRDRSLAEEMYEKLTYFSGYGFCRSHAAAFAKTVYQTAFLKTFFPAEFLAAILSNEPCCYYPTQTVIEEARKWRIEVLPVDVNRSRVRYWVERGGQELEDSRQSPGQSAPSSKLTVQSTTQPAAAESRKARSRQHGVTLLQLGGTVQQRSTNALPRIRMGFLQVKSLSEDVAATIVRAREESGEYRNLADFWRRTGVDRDAVQNLIAVGAFDSLGTSRRQLLWHLEEVMRKTPRLAPLSSKQIGTDEPRHSNSNRRSHPSQLRSLPPEPVSADPLPDLPALTELDLAGLDMTLQNASARYSVMMFYRRSLQDAGIMSIGAVLTKPNGLVLKTAGIVISRQQPPTAKGMTFLVLSDEEGELPAAIPPHIYERCRRTLSSSASLVVEGTLQRHRRYVSLMINRLWNMREVAHLDTVPYTPTDQSAKITA